MLGSTVWKQYVGSWLPLGANVSLPALVAYSVLFLGLYWLLSSLWGYYQLITWNSLPGSTPLPFLGNFGFMLVPGWLLQLLQFGIDGNRLSWATTGATRRGAFLYPHIVLSNMAKLYGKIYGIYIGSRLIVILNDFDTVKDALVTHSEVFWPSLDIAGMRDVATDMRQIKS